MLSFLIIFFLHGVACQDSIFIAVQDHRPDISSLSKNFQTKVKIELRNSSIPFNETIFIDALTRFHTSASITGFLRIQNVSNSNVTTLQEISYTSVYNGSVVLLQDAAVIGGIGSLASLSNLQNINEFNDSYVLDSVTSFLSASTCTAVSCAGTQLLCVESELGLNVTCKSLCKDAIPVCKNDGICLQDGIDEAPYCRCKSSNSEFNIGRTCEVRVVLWMIIVLLLGCVLLIVLIILIGCGCMKLLDREPKHEEKQSIINSAAAHSNSSPPSRAQNDGKNRASGPRKAEVNVQSKTISEPMIRPRESGLQQTEMPDFLRQPEPQTTRRAHSESSYSPEENYPEHVLPLQREDGNHGDDERESTSANMASDDNRSVEIGELSSINHQTTNDHFILANGNTNKSTQASSNIQSVIPDSVLYSEIP